MKSLSRGICFGLLAAAPVLLANRLMAADAPAAFTLAQALAQAESGNLNALLGRESVVQAVEAARQQRSNLLPKITFDTQQQRQQQVQTFSTGAVQNAPADKFSAGLLGSLTLLNPAQIAGYQSARAGVQLAQLGYQSALQTALATVAQTYFTHLRDLQSMEVIKANIAQAQSLLDLAQAQLKAGVATQIDVTRAESQLAIAQQSSLQQETVIYQSALQLKELLGFDAARPLHLATFAVRRQTLPSDAVAEEATALEKRPDYQQAVKAVEVARLAVRAARYERLPVLTLTGQYGYANTVYNAGHDKTAWLAGVDFNVPVFDGLKIGSDRRLAESLLRSQQYRLNDLRRQIASQVLLADQDARSRNAQIDVAQKGYDLAVEELRLARTRFEQGVADNTEVVNAQNALAVAADNLVEAQYQYNLSWVNLAATLGDVRLILDEQGAAAPAAS